MFSKQFTNTEKVMLGVLTAIILGALYFFFIHIPITAETERVVTQKNQFTTELQTLQEKNTKMTSMKKAIAELDQNIAFPVQTPEYDNLESVIKMLNTIMPATSNYVMDFSPLITTEGDSILRRPIEMSFEASSYTQAYDIINRLHDGPFRCQITDLTVTANAVGETREDYLPVISQNPVVVQLTIIYFETVTSESVIK